MKDRRVLIVGGGIAGLALAPLLAGRGFSVEVVERAPEWQPAGTGLYLTGNATRALAALGLAPRVARKAIEIPHQLFSDHRGRLLFDIDVADMWSGVGPCLAMHRSVLHDALRHAARDAAIRMGVTVSGLAYRHETVSVDFSDGTSGDYELVVGADGIHSTVRRLAFGSTAAPRQVGQVGWRFLALRPVEVATWSVMLGPTTAFLTLPIGGGRVYCYCDVASPDGSVDADSVEQDRVDELFSGFAEPVPSLLRAMRAGTSVHVSPIEEVVIEDWAHERVVVIGDAAHATSPNMAQGAAMALEDALVLSECLGAIDAIPDAIAAFQARRRPRTDWVRAQTHRRDHTRHLPPTLRNGVMHALGRRIFRAHYRPLLREP
jgi:2-polyprenyl-6-methoxyphenol hydroxylase-like FAD-dependent oxidoreductase